MPDEAQEPTPVENPPVSEVSVQAKSKIPKLTKKQILIIAAFVLAIIVLGLMLIYFNFLAKSGKNINENKVATTSVKLATKKTERVVWVRGKEIWVKEGNKLPEKIFTETRRIMDWDVDSEGNLVYIVATAKNKDTVYGTELIRLKLATLEQKVLFQKTVAEIDKEISPNEDCQSQDPDLSSVKFSPDGKYLVFAATNLKILDTKIYKLTKEIDSSTFRRKDGNLDCLYYGSIRWFSDQILEISIGRWESGDNYTIDLQDKSVLSLYGSGYQFNKKLTLEPKALVLTSLSSSFDVASDSARTSIGEAKTKYSIEMKNTLYQSKEGAVYQETNDGATSYFFEEESTLDNQNHKLTLKSLDITSGKVKTLKVLSDIKNSNSAPYANCLSLRNNKLYYQFSEGLVLTLYDFDLSSQKIENLVSVTRNKNDTDNSTGFVGCLSLTAY